MNRAILLLAALAACTGGETATTPEPEIVADPATDEAANIAAIALEIRAAPSDAATILASHDAGLLEHLGARVVALAGAA